MGPGSGLGECQQARSDQAEPGKRLLDLAAAQRERVLSGEAAVGEAAGQIFPAEARGFLGLRREEGLLLQRRRHESALLVRQRAEGQGVPLL